MKLHRLRQKYPKASVYWGARGFVPIDCDNTTLRRFRPFGWVRINDERQRLVRFLKIVDARWRKIDFAVAVLRLDPAVYGYFYQLGCAHWFAGPWIRLYRVADYIRRHGWARFVRYKTPLGKINRWSEYRAPDRDKAGR